MVIPFFIWWASLWMEVVIFTSSIAIAFTPLAVLLDEKHLPSSNQFSSFILHLPLSSLCLLLPATSYYSTLSYSWISSLLPLNIMIPSFRTSSSSLLPLNIIMIPSFRTSCSLLPLNIMTPSFRTLSSLLNTWQYYRTPYSTLPLC